MSLITDLITGTAHVAQSHDMSGGVGQMLLAFVMTFISQRGQYRVTRSLRLRSAASASLSRTPGGAGNRKILAGRVRIKRSGLGTTQVLMSAGTASIDRFYFDSSDRLCLDVLGTARLVTTRVFRDPSAWLDVGFELDVGNGTAASRAKIFIEEVEATAYSTDGRASIANTDTNWNSTVVHYIGRDNGGSYFDGYIAEPALADGSKVFAYSVLDSVTGVRIPSHPSATWGTCGFYLPLSDNSAATAAALGADRTGNGNNWTPNNISVTAGVTNDSLVDTPTNYGIDTGAGGEVRGNYCTLNPIFKNADATYGVMAMPANGNLEVSMGAGTNVYGSIAIPRSGKWYAECRSSSLVSRVMIGFMAADGNINRSARAVSDLGVYVDNVQQTSSGYVAGDIIGIAVDYDAGTVQFYRNGAALGSAYAFSTGYAQPHLFWAITNSGVYLEWNFGQRPFAYAAPSGFKALCTQNLPDPAIKKPSDYFDVNLRTGTGATFSVTGKNFQPDLVWSKSRSAATDHAIYDSVRGVQKQLESNTTSLETTESTGLTAFNSDGFSGGALAQLNTNAATYVDWLFKKGVTPGLDIVGYTGTGANKDIAHSLGAVPVMTIIKERDTTARNWYIAHVGIGATDYLVFDTAAKATLSTVYRAAPDSSSVYVGNSPACNENGAAYIMFTFAEVPGFSKFGSYTGNGSADGPFVWCGFKPRWIMVKRIDSTGGWSIVDTARNPYNLVDDYVLAEINSAEATGVNLVYDILANGFKIRGTGGAINASGGNYIFAAFAEAPFKTARAR